MSKIGSDVIGQKPLIPPFIPVGKYKLEYEEKTKLNDYIWNNYSHLLQKLTGDKGYKGDTYFHFDYGNIEFGCDVDERKGVTFSVIQRIYGHPGPYGRQKVETMTRTRNIPVEKITSESIESKFNSAFAIFQEEVGHLKRRKEEEERRKTELKDMFSNQITIKDVSPSTVTGVMGDYEFRIEKSYDGFKVNVSAPKMTKEQVDRLLELFRLWSG
jgi:hypothetical protein